MTTDIAAASLAQLEQLAQAARSDLAPTGRLRAAINLSNTLFTNPRADAANSNSDHSATADPEGVSVDVMRELAARLGVPLQLVVYPTPGEVADLAEANVWDAAILAIEPARAKTIDFSPPISAIEATYVVHADSPLRAIGDVDASGVRVSAPEKAGYELYLARTLKNATLVRAKTFGESVEAFVARRADALSGLKPALLDIMHKLDRARMLEGKFMTVNHGIGTPLGRPAASAFVTKFVDHLNASGFIARSIQRHQVKGLSPVS